MKIEPMRREPINADDISHILNGTMKGYAIVPQDVQRLIYALAQERARANHYLFKLTHPTVCRACTDHLKITWIDADWLNEVLDEIGWPKDGRD